MQYDDLIKKAIDHYNDIWIFKYEKFASINSDISFLHRIARNYLRHELCKYDENLAKLYKKVGKDTAYNLLRSRIDEEIDKKYPELVGY